MTGARKAALAIGVAATIFVLAAALLTANAVLYILAGLAVVSTIMMWRGRESA